MRFPPRLSHLATRAVVVARFVPTFAQAHQIEEDEARQRLEQAIQGRLLEDLLEATWRALLGSTKRLTEDGLLEKVAKTLQDRPLRPGRKVEVTAGLSAFFLQVDLAAGTASDAAARVLEGPEGQKRIALGLDEAGAFVARELTRGK